MRVPKAVIAPAMPAPNAVPRMSDSWRADDAAPVSVGFAPRSTTSVTAEYMKPIPRPGSSQVKTVSSAG